MSGVNKAIVIGHLGADPEVKSTTSGAPVARFSVATSETWKDKATGERKERTDWHRVVVWNEGLCKVVQQYLRKGSKVYVEGRMQTRKWTDQGGVERYVTEIVLTGFNATIALLDRREGVPGPSDADAPSSALTGGGEPARSRKDDMDDEIPF